MWGSLGICNRVEQLQSKLSLNHVPKLEELGKYFDCSIFFDSNQKEKYFLAVQNHGKKSVISKKKWKKVIPKAIDIYSLGITSFTY